MVVQLAGRISALQSLILSLVEDNGQACPSEFLERLQEELEAAVTSINRCTRSNGYRERYFDDITIDLKDVNFRIVNWLGDMRAHMVSAGMLEGRDQPHHQSRALRILKEIRDSQERFEDFGSFADAEMKDSRGESADPNRKSVSGRKTSMDLRRVRRSIGGGSRQGSLSMEYRSRPNSIERSRNNSFSSEDSRRDYRPRSLWTESVLEEEARIDELRRRARAELGEMNREKGSGRRSSDDYYRQKGRDSRDYARGERRDSEEYYRERGRRESEEMYQREKRGGRQSLGEGHAILAPAEAVNFHDEVDRVLAALDNTGDMDRVIQQIIETQTLGEREREFLLGKSERLKKERAAEPKGPVFGDVGVGPWGGSDEDAETRANRARPAEDTEQQLLKDVEEARKLAREFRDGKKQYREVQEELLGSDLGYLPQTVKEEAAVAVVEITTALAVAESATIGSETGEQPWTYSPPRGGMDSIPEGSIGVQTPLVRKVSAALVAAGNDAPTRRMSSGGAQRPSIIPLDLPKAARLKRTRSNEPTTLEDDIAAALKAQQEVAGQAAEKQLVAAPGVIAIGQNGPVAIGAKGAGITGWPAGLLRTASIPPGPASRTNPEALLKDKQREEASVMEKVYTALKAVKIGELMKPEELLEGDGKRTSFCELPTGPRVLRKDTKEVKKEIVSFMDEINAALEKARSGPPPGSENLSREPPAEFICPLSGALMRDPVLLIETEHNYERVYIERWFARGHRVCPASGVAVHTTTTLRNHKLRGQILDWVKLEEISPRVELVQPRAEVPLSSTPRGTPEGVPRGTFEARGPPSSGASSTISMNGRHDDIILDLAPDGSVEAAQAEDGAQKIRAEQPVEPVTPAGVEGPGALPNGRGKESEIGHEVSEAGAQQEEKISGAEIVATGSAVEEIVAEEGKGEEPVTGAAGEAESSKEEQGAEAPKRLLTVTSRVKSAIEFFNSAAFVPPQAS
ncbi:hypothetical protein KFL_001080050 [Klebsormidium nitens]|uniref:U-box domain-containing protein n=1 Tax=Klebsormidium nitens TaxID=105231 RepID=A0A1Y1HYQ9_KLENI|nr:hypothetical protein KFL_001080050 [Klebsormidium nitens]|eukprot:GAQ82329.1 hypothetical protein KFL_001080050 [Klebsormidium nitens]